MRAGLKPLAWLALLASCAAPSSSAQNNSTPILITRLPAPAVSLAWADSLYALTQGGELWATSPLKRVTADLSVDAPLSSCGGKVLAVTRDGKLWWGGPTTVSQLSPLSGPACASGGAVLAVGQGGELVRIEIGGQESSRAKLNLLPDTRPGWADLRGNGDPSLTVLAGPSGRYAHGVLGDKLEATELLAVDRHTLNVEYRLTLPAPFVFEDWEARPLKDGQREVLALVRSGPIGGAALIIAGLSGDKLGILAAGPDFGQPSRWLAPASDGASLYAVHTPHIGGVLNKYTFAGNTLKAVPVSGVPAVSTHRIGQRLITGGVWQGNIWVGNQAGTQTLNTAGLPALKSAPSTPLLRASGGAYLGLQDGSVVKLP
ncbi:hypothetical protein [Deinococcus sp.]|uniref:hypothetical protein n=1 Tax=Deinococcus sp. TaxID=47478 RepID=UPI003B5C2EF1